MFTGIITDIGEVVEVKGTTDLHLKIACDYDPDNIDTGASIACSGVCLTVVEKGRGPEKPWFKVDVSSETERKTTAGSWAVGTRVNLERALKMGDELGGHMVLGHVDGVAKIISCRKAGDSRQLRFSVGVDLSRYIAPKGSVCLDGTSFTVNDAGACEFDINIIPHTLAVTTWGDRDVGDSINLEIDVIARYVARLNSETNN